MNLKIHLYTIQTYAKKTQDRIDNIVPQNALITCKYLCQGVMEPIIDLNLISRS